MTQLQLPLKDENLTRVSGRIAGLVFEFVTKRLEPVTHFRAEELRQYVEMFLANRHIAPGSVDRVLRDLRKRGVLNYRVVSRRDSLYEVIR